MSVESPKLINRPTTRRRVIELAISLGFAAAMYPVLEAIDKNDKRKKELTPTPTSTPETKPLNIRNPG